MRETDATRSPEVSDQNACEVHAPISEEVFAETLRAKVREITALIKNTGEGRDFHSNPISVEEVSELLAVDMDLEMLPPPVRREQFFWQGDSHQAHSSNAYMLILTYCTDSEF